MITQFQGRKPVLGQRAYVDQQARVIGQVTIGDDSSIWPMAVVRGDVNSISIGKNTSIQDGSVLHCTHDGPYTNGGAALVIGDNNTIGHNVNLHACTIKTHCLIGIGTVILDRAIINDYTMIAANSLVPPGKELEGGFLYMGLPVKKIRALSKEEKEQLEYSARHYVRLKDKYLEEI